MEHAKGNLAMSMRRVTLFQMKTARALVICVLALPCIVTTSGAETHSQKRAEFPLWQFDKLMRTPHTCAAKGRLQDKGYCDSKVMDAIIAKGPNAIPILISQLTDTRATAEPIFDYWSKTTAGDIAHAILNDLFTDSDLTTFTLPGLERVPPPCDEPAETCWRDYVKKRGLKFVQAQWRSAWNANKDRLRWDDKARCFRVLTPAEVRKAVKAQLPRYARDIPQPIPQQLQLRNAPKTVREIQCFRSFKDDSSVIDVVRQCGIPDEQQGSGIYILVYHLDDGSAVFLGTADLHRLMYLTHVTALRSYSLLSKAKDGS
jgi:hypothetical protein